MTFRPLAAALLLIALPAVPTGAFDAYLDHNTDANPYTFSNVVEGAVSASIDVIVSAYATDPIGSAVIVYIEWGYTPPDPGGDPDCYDLMGSVPVPNNTPFPDSGPFTGIVLLQGETNVVILATITGAVQPGNYVLASVPLSRVGRASSPCGPFTWGQADFESRCFSQTCATGDGDPRRKMTLVDAPTSVEKGSWGRVKSLYR